MTIADFTPRQALDQLNRQPGLTDEDLSMALGVSKRTLIRWRTAEAYPQRDARHTFDELLELADDLDRVFESREAGHTWLRSSNRYLGGLTPRDAIRVQRADRSRAALEALESGVYL